MFMTSPKRRFPPPPPLTVPKALKGMQNVTLLSTLLSLDNQEEEHGHKPANDDEQHLMVRKDNLLVSRICYYHYCKAAMVDVSDNTQTPWPVLVRNVSLVVQLDSGLPAIPYYLHGSLVSVNLSLAVGVVRVKLATTTSVVIRNLTIPLYRIMLLDAPGADSSVETLLVPRTWNTSERRGVQTLTDAQVKKIVHDQLVQEGHSTGYATTAKHPSGLSNNIFETIGESRPDPPKEKGAETAFSYRDNCLLNAIKSSLTYIYWSIQRQVRRPMSLQRALNTLLHTYVAGLVYDEHNLALNDLTVADAGAALSTLDITFTMHSNTILRTSVANRRSCPVLLPKNQSMLLSQMSQKPAESLLANTGSILKRAGNRVCSVPKALPKLAGTAVDAGEADLTMTQLQRTSSVPHQGSPAHSHSHSQIAPSLNPSLRASSPILPARRGHMTQTIIASTRIPLLPTTSKVDSRVIKMTQMLNAMLDETHKNDTSNTRLLDDVVHDPERDFKQELEDVFHRHMNSIEEEFFLSVTAAQRRFQSQFCSVLADMPLAAKEYEVHIPKLGLLRPSLYIVGRHIRGAEVVSMSFSHVSTLPLGLFSHQVPLASMREGNVTVYGKEYIKRRSQYKALKQALSSQIRFQPCYIEHATPLVGNIVLLSETMLDIFLDLKIADPFNIRSCNLSIDKEGNISIGSAHQLLGRKAQVHDYTDSIEDAIRLFLQYIDSMIAKINQYSGHIKFFENHSVFEEQVDYYCNQEQLHDTRKKISIELANLQASENTTSIESVIKSNSTIFIKILKFFLFFQVSLVPYSIVLTSTLIYYQYLHNHLILKLEKDNQGGTAPPDGQKQPGDTKKVPQDIMAVLATVKLYDATRIYYTVARMVASALNDLAERGSYKAFMLALKPLNEFQFSEQGMDQISTLEDLSLIASRMYNFGFSRFDFVHNVIFPQRSNISFIYGANQQVIQQLSKLDDLQPQEDNDGNKSPEESFNPDNCETSDAHGDEAHKIKTVHKKPAKLRIETLNKGAANEDVAEAQEALAAELGIHRAEVSGYTLANCEESNYLTSVPPITSSIGYHYSFFDLILTFTFNLSISVVMGINWANVEATPLDSLVFTYFASYMMRYPKNKFILSIQEQNRRFQRMAGMSEDALEDTDGDKEQTADEPTDTASVSAATEKPEPKENPVLVMLQKEDKLIEIYDHEVADMYLDLPIVLMGNAAVIANRLDEPSTNIGDVRVVQASTPAQDGDAPTNNDNLPVGISSSFDIEQDISGAFVPPSAAMDAATRQRQGVLSRYLSKRDRTNYGYDHAHSDVVGSYVALVTHKKLSLLSIKERGVVTRLELTDKAKEFSCLLDLTQDLFSDDFSPTSLLTKYKSWFSSNKQIEALLSFDYERSLKIKEVKDLLIFSNHDEAFPMLDFQVPQEIMGKMQNLRAIIKAFPDHFYASMFTVSIQRMRESLLEATDYLEKHMMKDLTNAMECFTNYILAELRFVSSLILSSTTTPEKFQLVRDLHNRFSNESTCSIFSNLYDTLVMHYGINYIQTFPRSHEKHLITLLEEPSRQFLRISLLAKKHSQNITDRINAYADYVIAVDHWVAQMAFSLADGLKIIFTIDYPSFREARNAPLTFAKKYPILCQDFELKLLTLDNYHLTQNNHLEPLSSEAASYPHDYLSSSNAVTDSEMRRETSTASAGADHGVAKNVIPPPLSGAKTMLDKQMSASSLAQTAQKNKSLEETYTSTGESYSLNAISANVHIFERDFIQSLVVACRLELHTKRISHASLIKDFQPVDDSEAANNQRIVCIRNNVMESVSSKTPGHKYIFSTAKLYKRPVHKPTTVYQRTFERYDMRRILSEYKFLLMELCALIRLLDRWRVYLLAANCSTRLLEVPVYPSPFAMLKLLAPIADVSITLFDIDSCHNHYTERTLRSYPHFELLMAIDRVAYGIRQARHYAQTSFVDVRTNKDDIRNLITTVIERKYKDKIDLSDPNGGEPLFMKYIKEMPDVAFSVSFDPWVEYCDNAENVLLLFIPPVSLLHQIGSSSLRPIHFQRITSLTGVFVEQSLSVKPQLLLDAFEKNNELLDFVLVLVQNASIDKEAIRELKQIERALYSIRIDATYLLQISSHPDAAADRAAAWKNFIHFAVITPANAEEICRESLVTISLILNNLGYSGARSIDYTQSFDTIMSQVASKSNILTARYLPAIFETHRQYLQQWRYVQNVEEYARDLEAMARLMLFMVTIFKRMPFLLHDLLTYQANANLISFQGPKDNIFTKYHKKIIKEAKRTEATPQTADQQGRKFGGAELTEADRIKLATRLKEEQRKKAFAVNVLSKQDITTLQAACAAWKDTISKFCTVEETLKRKSMGARILKNISASRSMGTAVPFICAVINMNVLKNLSKHLLEIDAIHKRLHFYQDFTILQLFQQQAPKTASTGKFSPYCSIKTSNPEILSIGPKKLVPWFNRKQYPAALFCSSICQVLCGEFPQKKSLFKLVTSLSYEVFHGLDDYLVDNSSILGSIINGIQSGDEMLMFTTPVEAPSILYLVPDAVTTETRASFVDATKKAWEEFSVAYMKFTGKGLNGESPPEGFFNYLHLEQMAQSIEKSEGKVTKTEVDEEQKKNRQKLLSSPFVKDPDGFTTYLKNNLFRSVIIAISTWLFGKTRGLIFKFAMEQVGVLDSLTELLTFFQNLILAVKINNMQKSPVYLKVFIQQLIDWYEYYQDLQNLLKIGDASKLINSNKSISFTIYDGRAHNLYVTSAMTEYILPYGKHWIGAPTLLDLIAAVSLPYRYAITSIINGFAMGIPAFVLTAANRSIYTQEPIKVALQICHLLGKRLICVCVAEFTFVKCLQRITACLCAGYIAVVFGIQYLPMQQIVELVSLSTGLRRKFGKIDTLCVAAELSAAEKKKFMGNKVFFGNSEMNYLYSQMTVRDADFSDFSDLGYLIFHLPELAPIITADKFYFVDSGEKKKEQGKPEEEQQQQSQKQPAQQMKPADTGNKAAKKNAIDKDDKTNETLKETTIRVQDSYWASYQLTEHGRACMDAFKHVELVYLEFEPPEASFKKVSPEFYHVFCELNNFLSSMGGLSCKLLTSDIQIIYGRAKDKADTACVAAITLDYILRQTVQFFSLGTTRAELRSLSIIYSQFVSAAFGLDKMNSTYLSRLARNFLGTIESARMHLGLKYAETGDKYTSDNAKNTTIKQVSFLKYYTDSLSRHISQQFQWYLNMFSQAHQLSLQTVFDVLFCNDLLRSFKPVMVIVPQISYLKTFASIIAAVRGWRMHYCFNANSIYSAHKAIQALDLNDSLAGEKTVQEHLIIVAPSNVNAFLQMFEIILGVSLGFPVITDDKNLSQMQLDVSHGPHYLIVVSPSFLPEIINYPMMKAICHRLILVPSIECADGSKKVTQGSLHIDCLQLLKAVQRNHSLWKYDLDLALEGMEHVNQYGEDPNTPLSRALESIVTSYRSIILHSTLKDRLLKTAEQRITALPTFVKGVFGLFYDVVTKAFGFGRSIEEVYLLRSIVYFFLYRVGVVVPKKRKLKNDLLRDVCEASERFDQNTASASVQRISDLAMGQRARDINAMTRIIGAQYINLTQTAAEKGASKKKDGEHPNAAAAVDPIQMKRNQLMVLGSLMQSRVRVSDDLYPFSEIAGFSKESLMSLEAKMKKLTADAGSGANISDIINNTLLLNTENDISLFGMGFQGSMCFSFVEKYLNDAFFYPHGHIEAFTNMSAPFFCAIWNACSLFYLTFAANGNWNWLLSHGPKTAHDLLSKKYTKVLTELSELQKVGQGTFCSLIMAIVLILSDSETPPSNLKTECLSGYTIANKVSISKLNHGLSNEQLMLGIRSAVQKVVGAVPKHMSSETFTYLDYKFGINKDKRSRHCNSFHTRIEFRVYRVGEGLLNNLTLDSDKASLEKNIMYVAEKMVSIRRKQAQVAKLAKEAAEKEKSKSQENSNENDEEGEERDIAREMALKKQQRREKNDINAIILECDRGEKVSLQSLLDVPIYFDSHRAAVLVCLGCAMLSPISLAVVGVRSSGKTVMLDAAKLLVRDLIDTNMILLSDLCTQSSTFSVLTGIAQKFILRNAAQSSVSRYISMTQKIKDSDSNMIFDYYSSLCFPSFHLHCSDMRDAEISEHLALLLRDHVILMDIAERDVFLRSAYSQEPVSVIIPYSIYPENLQNFKTGCVSLSDCSIILECDVLNQELAQTAALSLQMPPITEPFLRSLCLKTYPNHTESWIFQFINGCFLIKGALPPNLINSFTMFDRLQICSSFLLQDPDKISDEMLAKIESYHSMGKNPGRLPPDSITNIVKANKDNELGKANIHALFGSIRNLAETNLIILQTIIERFASLSILGYLDEDIETDEEEHVTALHKQQLAQRIQIEAATPWSDARLLVKGNFILTTAWERYILDQSIKYMIQRREEEASKADNPNINVNTMGPDNKAVPIPIKSKREISEQQNAKFSLGNRFMIDTLVTQNIIDADPQDSPIKVISTVLERQPLLLLNYRSTNPFWFMHLMAMMKLYGQDLDPFITCRALEVFLIIYTRRELNLAKLNCLLKYGISVRSTGSMSAILGEDPLFPTRLHVLKQASLFAARILAYTKHRHSSSVEAPNHGEEFSLDDPQVQAMVAALCHSNATPDDRELMRDVITELEAEIKVAEDLLQQEHEDTDDQVQFDGLPLLTMLSMKPNKAIIRIDNSPSGSYNQIVRLLAALGNYTILSSDRFKQAIEEMSKTTADEDMDDGQSEMSRGSSRSKLSSMSGTASAMDLAGGGSKKHAQQRIIVDMTTILSHLDGQTIMRTKKPARGERKEAKENLDLIENLKKMIAELQSTSSYNSDTLDFLAVIMILRVSFAMALGIKPEILLSSKAAMSTVSPSLLNLGLNVNSSLTTALPSRIIGTGRGVSQLPLAVSSWPEYMQKIEQYSKILHEDHINLEDVDLAQQNNDGNDGNKQVGRDAIMGKCLLHSPINVMIVTPMSTLMRASPTGVTAYTLLCRSLEPLNILQSIFDEEEVQSLCNLALFSLGLDIAADSRVLVSLLSLTLSVVIVDDFPLNCADKISNQGITVVSASECMRAKVLSSIKSPILELIPDLTTLHKEMVAAQAAKKQAEQAAKQMSTSEDKSKLSLVHPQLPDAPLQIKNTLEAMLQKRLQECNYNIITMSKLDLLSVFQLSDCKLPTEVVLPAKVEINWPFFQHTFMVASVGVYRFCSANSINACPSMAVFTLLASQICNTLLSKVATFMSMLNTFFIALRLYEALASPSRTKPKILDVSDLSPDSVAKIVDQALKAQTMQDQKGNDSASKRQRDLIMAIAEAVVMRDLVHTCINVLKTDFRVMASAARSAALDSVAIAASLLFSIPGLVLESTARDAIMEGIFGDVPLHILQLLDQSVTNPNICCFNVMIMALYSSLGFKVELPNMENKTFGFDNDAPIPLCNATLQHGRFAFIGHLVEILGADWPVLLLLKNFHIPWSMGDPALLSLYTVALRYSTGSTVFCVDETVGMATACFLEGCKKQAAQGVSYHEKTASVVQYGFNEMNPNIKELAGVVVDLQKHVLVIDMNMPPREFSTLLARGLSTGESTLLFINVESRKTNTSNYTTLRKFMVLRSRRTIGKRQTIAIGSVTAITAQALHNYIVVFALGTGMNLSDVLINAGLFTQQFINEIAVCTQYSPPTKKAREDTEMVLLQTQKHMMSQVFLESIFGESEGIRSRNERTRLNNVKFSHLVNECSERIKSYLMVHVLNLSADKIAQTGSAFVRSTDPQIARREMEQAAMNQIVTQLTSSADSIQHICFTASFVLHGSTSRRGEIGQVLSTFKELVILQNERYGMFSDEEDKSCHFVDTAIKVRCAVYDIINTYGQALCDDMGLAINTVIYYLRRMAHVHLPAFIGYSRDFFILFHLGLSRAMVGFRKHLRDKYSKDHRFYNEHSEEYMHQNGLINMQDENILAFCIKYDPGALKSFLSSVMIPLIEDRIYNIFPSEMANGIWHMMHVVFSTAMGDLSGLNKERPYPINPAKENLTAPALSLFAILRPSIRDLLMLLTTQQIMSAFYAKSKFALTKIEADNLDVETFNDIKHIIPEVTSMSPKVIVSWIYFCLLGRYNPIIANSLTWFLKHHAAFVCFSKCEQPFASVLAFYTRNNMAVGAHSPELSIRQAKEADKGNILQQWYFSLMKDAMASNYQVFKLPPMLAKQDNQSFFALFSLSAALKPDLMIETFEAMSILLEKRCGPSAWKLAATRAINVERGITALYRSDMKATSSTESSDLVQGCIRLLSPGFRNLLAFTGMSTKSKMGDDLEIPIELVSDAILQLYDVYTFSFKAIDRYQAKITEINNNKQIMKEKKPQHIMALGPSPIQISIIYHDRTIEIDHMCNYIHLLPNNPYRGIPANFAKSLSFKDITQTMTIVDADPLLGGSDLLQDVINILKQKATVRKYDLVYPIFILIPSSPMMSPSLRTTHCNLNTFSHAESEHFFSLLYEISILTVPNYIYIQHPHTLDKAFVHYFCLAIVGITLLALIGFRLADISKIPNFQAPVTMRGMVLFVLKHALLSYQSTSFIDDTRLFYKLKKVMLRIVSKQVQKFDQTSFLSCAYANYPLLHDNATLMINRLDLQQYKRVSKVIIDLNFGRLEALARIIPLKLVISELQIHDEVVVRLLKETMRAKAQKVAKKKKLRMAGSSDEVGNEFSSESSIADSSISMESSSSKASTMKSGVDKSMVDGGLLDFDDVESMAESDSMSSHESSITARSRGTSILQNNQGPMSIARVEEDDIYEGLLMTIQIAAGNLTDERPIDAKKIENSVRKLIEAEHRSLTVVDVPNLAVERAAGTSRANKFNGWLDILPFYNDISEIIDLIQQMHLYSDAEQGYDQTTSKQKRRILTAAQHAPPQEFYYRHIFSSNITLNTLSTVANPNFPTTKSIINSSRKQDLNKMTASFRMYIMSHECFKHLQFGSFSRNLPTVFILKHIIPNVGLPDMFTVDGTAGFGSFPTHWIVNANTYGPILGDVLNFLRMHAAVLTSTPINRQRVIVSAKKPLYAPQIKEDGTIDTETKSSDRQSQAPFYLIIRNLELFNICYDTVLETVCADTVERAQGYNNCMELYAYCVITNNVTATTCTMDATKYDGTYLRVPSNVVPVPIRIGGRIHPLVYLPNKTSVASEEWLEHNPFFGIRVM